MKRDERKIVLRCAVYTRVSTDSGLEQDFNSLDNQREASEAYIKSQAHEGWRLAREHYDDGGFSGGSMERPALQKLLEDVKARKIDVIVVYKVDRLTRSLADFAKLVELFDARDVSFISVTQAFNTTTSMGRLTLNMLLSFAQFEREITGERIRDKVAASKRKGIWMGGAVPLGYRVEDRALHVVEAEAEFVRSLFLRYLEFGSVVRLKTALDAENVRSPVRTSRTGRRTGGVPISRGHLYWILSNPIYVGRLRHKGQIHEGLHPAIIDLETWEHVQQRLASQTRARRVAQPDDHSFLAGKLFDDRGMRPRPDAVGDTMCHAPRCRDEGKRLDRSCAFPLQRSKAGLRAQSGRIWRVGRARSQIATSITASPAAMSRARRANKHRPPTDPPTENDVRNAIERVAVSATQIEIVLSQSIVSEGQGRLLTLPWSRTSSRRRREIIQGVDELMQPQRAMRTKARDGFVKALRAAHRWLDELLSDPTKSIESLAVREGKSERSIRMTLSLAFLSPILAEAAMQGRLPRGFSVKRLTDLPMVWAEQWRAVGLREPIKAKAEIG
jgi:DNA invertase Pin-like site-specific DNA recombinase